jgi:hypothetical protein
MAAGEALRPAAVYRVAADKILRYGQIMYLRAPFGNPVADASASHSARLRGLLLRLISP